VQKLASNGVSHRHDELNIDHLTFIIVDSEDRSILSIWISVSNLTSSPIELANYCRGGDALAALVEL
jgi:hypothetical protein